MPALVLTFLVVIFLAILFGKRILERAQPMDIQYSARYHELNAKESLNEDEQAELAVERCRYDRAVLYRLKQEDRERYEHARSRYEDSCQDKLPL